MRDNDKMMEDIMKRMEEISTFRLEGLQKLLNDPDKFTIAQEVADNLLGAMSYLFNFTKIIDHEEQVYWMKDIYDRMEDTFLASFKSMTGKDYVPVTLRHFKKLQENRQKYKSN